MSTEERIGQWLDDQADELIETLAALVCIPSVIGKEAEAQALGAGLHGADEYVELDSVIEVARTLAIFAMRWCGV